MGALTCGGAVVVIRDLEAKKPSAGYGLTLNRPWRDFFVFIVLVCDPRRFGRDARTVLGCFRASLRDWLNERGGQEYLAEDVAVAARLKPCPHGELKARPLVVCLTGRSLAVGLRQVPPSAACRGVATLR